MNKPRGSDRLLPLVPALAAFVVFCRSLAGEFVDWDDPICVVHNRMVEHPSWSSFMWTWRHPEGGHYIPLTSISLGIDRLIWGMNPMGFHLTNILIHALSASLFFLCARKLFAMARGEAGAAEAALVAALLFALHPLRVESVSWITERRDTLSVAFLLGSLLLYLRAVENRLPLRGALTLYVLSLLSKASGLVFPLLLLLLDYYPLERKASWGALVREKIGFFLMAGVAVVAMIIAQLRFGAAFGLSSFPLTERAGAMAFSGAFYLVKTVWPSSLLPLYPLREPFSVFDGPYFSSALAVSALSWLIWRRRHDAPAVAVSWAWYLLCLAPISGVVRHGLQIVADRYSYMSCMPFALLAASPLQQVRGRSLQLARAVAATICLVLAGLTLQQQLFWKGPADLWARTLQRVPCHVVARFMLGNVLLSHGERLNAIHQYEAALACDPRFEPARTAMTNAYWNPGAISQ